MRKLDGAIVVNPGSGSSVPSRCKEKI